MYACRIFLSLLFSLFLILPKSWAASSEETEIASRLHRARQEWSVCKKQTAAAIEHLQFALQENISRAETPSPIRQELLQLARERDANLDEQKEVLEEGDRLLADIARAKEQAASLEQLKAHIRSDILSDTSLVTDDQVRIAKLESDIATANLSLGAQETFEINFQMRLNESERDEVSVGQKTLKKFLDKLATLSAIDKEDRRELAVAKQIVFEERAHLLDLQSDLTELKKILFSYRQRIARLDADIKQSRWQVMTEKLAQEKALEARKVFIKSEQRFSKDRDRLEKDQDALTLQKQRWDKELARAQQSPPSDHTLFLETIAMIEKQQTAIDQQIALIREKITAGRLKLSVDFIGAEIAHVRAQMADARTGLKRLRSLRAYGDELAASTQSEEMMIRNREALFKLRQTQTEKEIETYNDKSDVAQSEEMRRTIEQITTLTEEGKARIAEFQTLFASELETVARKVELLTALRSDLTALIAARPDAQLTYRIPFSDHLLQGNFWAALAVIAACIVFLLRRRRLINFSTDRFSDHSFLKKAFYQWLERFSFRLPIVIVVMAVVLILGWKNFIYFMRWPMAINVALIGGANLVRRSSVSALNYFDLFRKRSADKGGSFQSILFVRTLLDIVIWGAVVWAYILIFNLSPDRPLVKKAMVVLTHPLVAIGKVQLTLMGIGKGVIVFLLFLYISRLLRLFLSDYFFPRTTLDSGVRNAVLTLSHYTFIVIGAIVALTATGIDLTALAVFAGALGVGIGFGLQNIANNFISGLILLFERPVKKGDFVQIGKEFGQIQKIGARSTLVQTRDNIFVVVPNTTLVAQEVVNWTHQDSKTRIRLPIAVAYDTEIEKLEKICLDIAASSASVLTFPVPEVGVIKFSDNALHIEFLVWVASPSVGVQNELYRKIIAAFRAQGIQLPPVQRDIYFRNVLPVEN